MSGVSTRRVDDLVRALGIEGMSRSEVSRICATLDAEVAAFRSRSLADLACPYLWLDATYLAMLVVDRILRQRPTRSEPFLLGFGIVAGAVVALVVIELSGDAVGNAYWRLGLSGTASTLAVWGVWIALLAGVILIVDRVLRRRPEGNEPFLVGFGILWVLQTFHTTSQNLGTCPAEGVLREGRPLAQRIETPQGERRLVVVPRLDPDGETYGVTTHLVTVSASVENSDAPPRT